MPTDLNKKDRALDAQSTDQQRVAIVVIGRNEGERLRRSLTAALAAKAPVVYADSSSTDNSPDLARELGATVVPVDPNGPQSAARGRTTGLKALLSQHEQIDFVQFLDGDTEVAPGWLDAGVAALEADPKLAAVCGRLREYQRDASIFRRLCDMEWDGPVGEIGSTGGNVMLRVSALQQVGGFVAEVVAGEEADLCRRLRAKGWAIRRLPDDMGTHDSGDLGWSGWWRRAVRTGYWEAAAVRREGADKLPKVAHKSRARLFWAVYLPLAIVGLTIGGVWYWPLWFMALFLLGSYARLWIKVTQEMHEKEVTHNDARLYATSCVLVKWPECLGAIQFWMGR